MQRKEEIMIETKPLHEMKLENYTLRVEDGELGISVLDKDNKTVFWLNAIGTATLKEWLKDFDPDGKWMKHQSVCKNLERAA